MSRHFNAQYQQFKTALQRKFNERYKTDASIQYTEQDLQHAALLPKPVVPKPYKPEKALNRFANVRKRQEPSQSQKVDDFEREYQAFIAKLKAEKEAKQEAEQQNTENTEQTAEK